MTECQMGFSLLTYTEMGLFNIYIKSYAPYKIYSTNAKWGNPKKWNKITLMTLILQKFFMPFRNYLLDKSNIFIGSLLIWGMWSGDRSLLRKILDYENQLLWHHYPWYYILITKDRLLSSFFTLHQSFNLQLQGHKNRANYHCK